MTNDMAPDFFIIDQVLEPGVSYVIGRENPKPDCPSVGVQACGLYTHQTVRSALARVAELEACFDATGGDWVATANRMEQLEAELIEQKCINEFDRVVPIEELQERVAELETALVESNKNTLTPEQQGAIAARALFPLRTARVVDEEMGVQGVERVYESLSTLRKLVVQEPAMAAHKLRDWQQKWVKEYERGVRRNASLVEAKEAAEARRAKLEEALAKAKEHIETHWHGHGENGYDLRCAHEAICDALKRSEASDG